MDISELSKPRCKWCCVKLDYNQINFGLKVFCCKNHKLCYDELMEKREVDNEKM